MIRARCLFIAVIAALAASAFAVVRPGDAPAFAVTSTIDLPTPSGSVTFGEQISVLPNGNFVVVDSTFQSIGAVRLYDGATNDLISTLTGSTPGDNVGLYGAYVVGDSNFVVLSPNWDSGAVDVGAATWLDGTTGLDGVVSTANSLVGTSTNDRVGYGYVAALEDDGFIVVSREWGDPLDVGAATWGNGNTGILGTVNAANSVIGSHTDDFFDLSVSSLPGGNGVLATPHWDNGTEVDAGAATWIDGTTGTAGAISPSISLVGTTADDQIGHQVTVLTNGNYVAASEFWDNGTRNNVGIATWGSASTGVAGVASLANSLIGQADDDAVGFELVGLTNGNYVVKSRWHSGLLAEVGAVTWGNGSAGTTGVVGPVNSIHGTLANDRVYNVAPLHNGHYVVYSRYLDTAFADAGGAMWADGTGPTAAAMSATNSIVGSAASDRVGDAVTPLTNGNYVVLSLWNTGGMSVGATTFAVGTGPSVFSVDGTNSLVGSSSGDHNDSLVIALKNGNYVVRSSSWDGPGTPNAGAVTWGSGTMGLTGVVSALNSVIGSTVNDRIGDVAGVQALPNGNAVIKAPDWDRGAIVDAGMARVISGTGPTVGEIDETNSLVGSTAMDRVGSSTSNHPNGMFLLRSTEWDNDAIVDAGAVTLLDPVAGTVGPVSALNSFVGSTAGDRLGSSGSTGYEPSGVVFRSSEFDHNGTVDGGARTFVDASGTAGPLTGSNSVFGSTAGGGGNLQVSTRYTTADALVVGRPNENTVTLLVTPDKTPPSFAPASDVTVHVPRGADDAVVAYALPVASDARSTPSVSCTPPPGSTFPLGQTTVTCTATDGVGLSATTSFTLTVTGVDDYIPLSPARVADTRVGFSTVDGIAAGTGQLDVGSTLELQVAGRGGVAADASAAALNVTVVDAVAPGFATAWPCGEPRPTASNLNFATGATVPNAVIAKIGAGGKVCLFTSQPIHFVVDVNGYAPATTWYRPLNPARLLDTRADGITVDDAQRATGLVAADSTTTLQITGRGGVPADATAVVLNVTSTESALDGYITAHPCGTDRPNASSVNGIAGSTVANLVISKIGTSGTVCLYSQSATHLIADVNGYFAPGGSYVPLVPARLQDTRPGFATVDGQSAGAGLIPLGTVTPLHVTGRGGVPDASTVVLNVTVTEPAAAGYVTAYPCGADPTNTTPPNASNLNYATGQTVANAALVKVGTGGNVCLYSSQPTHLIVDVNGYFPD